MKRRMIRDNWRWRSWSRNRWSTMRDWNGKRMRDMTRNMEGKIDDWKTEGWTTRWIIVVRNDLKWSEGIGKIWIIGLKTESHCWDEERGGLKEWLERKGDWECHPFHYIGSVEECQRGTSVEAVRRTYLWVLSCSDIDRKNNDNKPYTIILLSKAS